MKSADDRPTASGVIKRSVLIAGHRTSISLEMEFWDGLRRIANQRSYSINRLVTEIDSERTGNLSSAIRVYVLKCYQCQPNAAPASAADR